MYEDRSMADVIELVGERVYVVVVSLVIPRQRLVKFLAQPGERRR